MKEYIDSSIPISIPIIQNSDLSPRIRYQYRKWQSNGWLIPFIKINYESDLIVTAIVIPNNSIIESFKLQ